MRKLIVLVLAVMMVLAMVPAVALAEEAEKGSEVIAASDVSYTITIPAQVNLGTVQPGGSAWVDPFAVSASNVFLEDGGYIDVIARGSGPNGEFRLYDQEGLGSNAMSYQLITPSGGVTAPNGMYAKITKSGDYFGKVGTSNASIPYAGSYKGVMTFTISYVGPTVENVPDFGETEHLGHLRGFPNLGTVSMWFKKWSVSELDSVEVSIYKDNKKLMTSTLKKDKMSGIGQELTCSNYADGYWDNDQGINEPGKFIDGFDKMSVKVVKDGKTYIFTSSFMRNSGLD